MGKDGVCFGPCAQVSWISSNSGATPLAVEISEPSVSGSAHQNNRLSAFCLHHRLVNQSQETWKSGWGFTSSPLMDEKFVTLCTPGTPVILNPSFFTLKRGRGQSFAPRPCSSTSWWISDTSEHLESTFVDTRRFVAAFFSWFIRINIYRFFRFFAFKFIARKAYMMYH